MQRRPEAPVSSSANPAGTQGIKRAITVLRELAAREHLGLRLVDISTALNLERPTAHRILKGLVAEGMVRQDVRTRRYHLGHLVYELGLSVQPRFNLKELCEPMLLSLARKTGDSIFLMVRSGLDAVCLNTVEGPYPIRTRTLDVGGRRPLGMGAGSLALLLALDDEVIEQVIEANAPRFATFGRMDVERIRAAIALSRKVGYAVNTEDVLYGVSAIGVPIRRRQGVSGIPSGIPYAAISIAGIESRFQSPRREELAALLMKEVRAIESKLDAVGDFWD
jgi:DNA-binding IclR family transcriptional regulator